MQTPADGIIMQGMKVDPPKMWKEPVLIKEEIGLTAEVKRIDSALRLIDRWPVTRRWRRAVDMMIQVNLGNEDPEKARRLFVEAAREARVLIER